MGLPLRVPVGALLLGYGLLVLVGVMPHESLPAGLAAFASGLLLLLPSFRRPAADLPAASRPRAIAVALLGGLLVAAVLAYNLAARSGLSLPEVAMVAYGAALVLAAPALHRRLGPLPVASLVGWSFPLLLAPLALFAVNAFISAGTGATAAAPIIQVLIVQPTAVGLRLLGTTTEVVGSTMVLPTPRGTLSLGVGLVCAGLYPIVLFSGLVAFHAWTERLAPRRALALLAAGVAGLWVVNLVRLVALAKVGVAWGPQALQSAHANLGWILFAGYVALFWSLALRPRPAPA